MSSAGEHPAGGTRPSLVNNNNMDNHEALALIPASPAAESSSAAASLDLSTLNLGRDNFTATEKADVYDWKTEDGKLRAHRADTKV